MNSDLKIISTNNAIVGSVNLPASKSISNRLLIIKYLSDSNDNIGNLSQADDTQLLKEILDDIKSRKSDKMTYYLKNAGTPLRFLTSVLSTVSGEFILDCDQRMKSRPIGDLVESLRFIGAEIHYLEEKKFPPLRIIGKKLQSKIIEIDASKSSQYISSLLMIAPMMPNGLEIKLLGNIASMPYIALTISIMNKCGIELDFAEDRIIVPAGKYIMPPMDVEFDWSSAAFFYELAAISNNSNIFIKGLMSNSMQGDSILPFLFEKLGVETIFENEGVRIKKISEAKKNVRFNFSDYPDIAMPFIVACAANNVIGTFTGLETLLIKESNRVEALNLELAKFGYDFRDTGFGEWVLLNNCCIASFNKNYRKNIFINTYQDHRVAMAFAPMVLLCKELTIENFSIVNKSYPNFWEELAKIVS